MTGLLPSGIPQKHDTGNNGGETNCHQHYQKDVPGLAPTLPRLHTREQQFA
jgi:hypothetical protein